MNPYRVLGISVPVALAASLLWLNYQHRALNDARRDAEAAHLELQHQIVARQEGAKALLADTAGLTAENSELRAALTEARRAAPGAVQISAASLQTMHTKVSLPEVLAAVLAPDNSVAPAVPVTGRSLPACALAAEDDAWFKVDLIELRTLQNNYTVVGTAELWRGGPSAAPPGARVLGPLRFEAEVSRTEAVAPAPEPRWGAALLGACGLSGCGLGAGVLFPPLKVLSVRLEPSAGLLLGPGSVYAIGSLGVRW